MLIDVGRLAEGGERIEGEDPPGILELPDGAGVTVTRPIRFKVTAQVVTGELIVRGRVEADADTVCSRCARPATIRVEDREFCVVRSVTGREESVDLTPDVRESILLVLPSYPVCQAGCRGLCPRCGKDLNEGPCECEPPSAGGWAALGQLRIR